MSKKSKLSEATEFELVPQQIAKPAQDNLKIGATYFSTRGNPYWRDRGNTPTALQTAIKKSNL